MKHTWGKNDKTVKEYWKQILKITKIAGGVADNFFGFPRRFLDVFFALSVLTSSGQIQRETKKFLSYSLVKKTLVVLKADKR